MVSFEELLKRNEKYAGGEGCFDLKEVKAAREETVKGQHPEVCIIACSDSRVAPETLLLAKPGEIFTIRTAGNVVDGEETLATIEYAVEHLKVKELVVMGHMSCGAVTATVEGGNEEGHLKYLMEKIKPAVDEARNALEREGKELNKENILERAIRINVMNVINEIQTRIPKVKELADKGELKLIPAYYNLETGKVIILE